MHRLCEKKPQEAQKAKDNEKFQIFGYNGLIQLVLCDRLLVQKTKGLPPKVFKGLLQNSLRYTFFVFSYPYLNPRARVQPGQNHGRSDGEDGHLQHAGLSALFLIYMCLLCKRKCRVA